MKKTLLLLLLFLSAIANAQEKLMTQNGNIAFEASVPFFEAVEAKNNKVASVLNTAEATIVLVAYIKDFEFERSLMKEHFNDNYLESKRYPKATFKGIIEKFDLKNIAVNPKKHYIKGKIYIHGKSKFIRVPALISQSTSGITVSTSFNLNTDDFKIEIPYIVRNKVSKTVRVTVNCILK
ncbi:MULTISPECIES: YceI family protein [unclassified Flavobacterium]|uniref:YceI family protein n=1 Tax=unclassified Flavobacterium TaxID=196869 RepID=UPI003F8F8B38